MMLNYSDTLSKIYQDKMIDTRIIPGKHTCGKDMDMRIIDVKDDNKNIVSWIVYGICKKCEVVLISELFIQSEKPMQDRDFIIDYERVGEKVREEL